MNYVFTVDPVPENIKASFSLAPQTLLIRLLASSLEWLVYFPVNDRTE
jgi:hypothetical protein